MQIEFEVVQLAEESAKKIVSICTKISANRGPKVGVWPKVGVLPKVGVRPKISDSDTSWPKVGLWPKISESSLAESGRLA